MSLRRTIMVIGMAGLCPLVGAAPALADGPPVPAGCTFGKGIETCISTSTATSTLGPVSTNGYVPASTVVAGFTGVQLCVAAIRPYTLSKEARYFLLFDYTNSVTTTTTTTTQRHGLHGAVIGSPTTTTVATLDTAGGGIGCSY